MWAKDQFSNLVLEMAQGIKTLSFWYSMQELIHNVCIVVWLGSTDDQIIISKRHGPLFHLLLSTMEKYEPNIESSPETTTQISTESTADFFESDGKNDFHLK